MVKAPRDLQITETQSRGCCQLAMKLLFCARGDEVREAEEKKKTADVEARPQEHLHSQNKLADCNDFFVYIPLSFAVQY